MRLSMPPPPEDCTNWLMSKPAQKRPARGGTPCTAGGCSGVRAGRATDSLLKLLPCGMVAASSVWQPRAGCIISLCRGQQPLVADCLQVLPAAASPPTICAGDDDGLDIGPGLRLPQVVEEALQHCRAGRVERGACRVGRAPRRGGLGGTALQLIPPATSHECSPSGCRAFTGGLCSVTTATPPSTSSVV